MMDFGNDNDRTSKNVIIIKKEIEEYSVQASLDQATYSNQLHDRGINNTIPRHYNNDKKPLLQDTMDDAINYNDKKPHLQDTMNDTINYNRNTENVVIKEEPIDYFGTLDQLTDNKEQRTIINNKTEKQTNNYFVVTGVCSQFSYNFDGELCNGQVNEMNNINTSQQGSSQGVFHCLKNTTKPSIKSKVYPLNKVSVSSKPKVPREARTHNCTECCYKASQKSHLRRHILTHTGEKPYACDQCSYRSPDKSSVRAHILTHTGEKPYACYQCSYRTSERSNLRRHTLTHTGEKPHACTQCAYRTSDKSSLRTHIMIHTGEKPHACDQCQYRTSDKSSLRSHTLTHTGEKPHSCGQCSYKTSKKSHLKIHTLIHTGNKPFACDQCSYTAAQKSNLRRHKLTHSDSHRTSPKYKHTGESSGLGPSLESSVDKIHQSI